jgi:hypothetical protein
MKKFIIFITIIIFINIIFPTKARAQESLSLSIYPPIIEIISKPDQTITQTYKIGNDSPKDIELSVQVVPFKPTGENGAVQLTPENTTPDRSLNWFSLANTDLTLGQSFTLKAAANYPLDLKIDIPKDAAYKDYYYALLVKSNPQVSTQGPTRTLVSGVIGSLILLSVADNSRQTQDLEISDFALTNYFLPNVVDSSSNITFKAMVKNMGKYYLKTEGQIVVSGVVGQTNVKIDLLPVNVLAFSSRQTVCVDSPDCQLPQRLSFGRFQAKLVLSSQGQKKEKSFYFYVLPIKFGFLILLTLILGLALLKMIFFVRKRYIKR